MLLYGIVIFFAMALISLVALLGSPAMDACGAGAVVGAVCAATAAIIALDGALAFLIRRLPARWFSAGRKIFIASRRECRFYIALGLRRWKDKIPELGMFTGFHKNKVRRPQDNSYIARFIMECNYGMAIHFAGAVFGFCLLLARPPAYALWVGLPVAVVNFVLNLLPLFVLRYNVPKLEALYARNRRRSVEAP